MSPPDAPLAALARAVAEPAGPARLGALVRALAELAGADTAYVSALLPEDPGRARVVALWDHGTEGDAITYALRDTPCEPVLADGELVVLRGVAERFADDPWFAGRDDSGFLGRRLDDAEGRPLAVLGLMHDAPLAEDAVAQRELLDVFASLITAELERTALQSRLAAARSSAGLAAARRHAPRPDQPPGFPVLVLDSDPQVCRVLRRALAAQGHDPVCLDSAEQLLRVAPQMGTGLVLLELAFPGAHAATLCAQLAEHAPDLRRVLLHGGLDGSSADPAAFGADALLLKPFAPAALLERIESFRAELTGAG